METVGERIKHLRKNKGMTQKEFADEVGISRSTLAGYETGKIEPSLHVVYNMANTFNINPTYFLRTMSIKYPDDKPKVKGVDILDRLDDLMNLIASDNIRVDNKRIQHGSDLSRLMYYEIKKTRESIIQFIKILEDR